MPIMFPIARSRAVALALVALGSTALTQAWAAEFASAINLGSLNGTTGFRLDGIDAGDQSGSSVASAGDVNGDGFADVMVGAPGADPGGNSAAGESYVVFGKGSGFAPALALALLDGIFGFGLAGSAADNFVGRSVGAAGDVNGDGFDDVMVGAPGAAANVSYAAGAAYVVFGKTGPFPTVIGLDSSPPGTTVIRFNGDKSKDYAGHSVALAGNVNGDGFADLVIGAYGADPGGDSAAGVSYVVFGKAAFFNTLGALSSLDGTNGFRLNGIDPGDRSGFSVAAAGDVNGDRRGDFLIGAFGADPGGVSAAGETYVVFGHAPAFASAIGLGGLNGATGFRLDGTDADDRSGFSIAPAEDVNGDGFADLVIGALRADPGGKFSAGETYVVFGGAGPFPSAIDLASLNGSTGFRLDGSDVYDNSGNSVASAGDVNGDGFADIVIGSYGGDPNGNANAGESYVVFGKAGAFSSAIALNGLDGSDGFRLDGAAAGDESGRSVAAAGDVNGDGFGDVMVGAPGADPGGDALAGKSFLVFGRPPNGPVTRVGSAAGQYISGGAFADNLQGRAGNDFLEGRAGADALIGGPGWDTAIYLHAPAAVRANLASPGANFGHAAGDSYTSIENLTGSAFNDVLLGNAGANVLTGGKGRDTMTGGGAPDIFLFSRTSDSNVGFLRDLISDFNAGSPTTFVDRIDLRPIDARTNAGGNQAFTYIGTVPFSGISGQLRIQPSGTAHAIVSGDVNGDKVADFEIALLNFTNFANLTAIDFLR